MTLISKPQKFMCAEYQLHLFVTNILCNNQRERGLKYIFSYLIYTIKYENAM